MPLRQLWFPTLVLAILLHTETSLSAPPSDASSSPASVTEQSSAQELFKVAQTQYAAGDMEGALATMQRCYEAKPSANVVFNLAQLHRELAHCGQALEHYQRYLEAAPNGERAVDAQRFVDLLLQQCPPAEQKLATQNEATGLHPKPVQSEPIPAPTSANSTVVQPQPPPELRSPWNTVGWVALGTGVVTGAASIYFAVAANHARSDAEGLDAAAESTAHPDANAIHARDSDFQRYRTLGWVFGGVAVTSMATCGFAWLVGSRRQSNAATALALTFSPNTLIAGYSAIF